MINYIKAEFYRVFSSKTIYIFLGLILGLSVLGNTFDHYAVNTYNLTRYTTIQHMYSALKSSNSMIFFMAVSFCYLIIQEYSQNTFKNIISSNLDRIKIYLSKLIMINILNLVIYLVFLLFNTVVVLVLFKIDNSLNLSNLFNFIKHIVFIIPLYVGVGSLGCFIAFLIKKEWLFIISYFFCFMFISNIIAYASYKYRNPKIAEINNYLIFSNLSLVSNMNVTSSQVIRASLVGLGFTLVFGILGYIVFKKQDIK